MDVATSPGSSDGLVGSLAAESLQEGRIRDRLAALGKVGHLHDEVDVGAADDDDLPSLFPAIMLLVGEVWFHVGRLAVQFAPLEVLVQGPVPRMSASSSRPGKDVCVPGLSTDRVATAPALRAASLNGTPAARK